MENWSYGIVELKINKCNVRIEGEMRCAYDNDIVSCPFFFNHFVCEKGCLTKKTNLVSHLSLFFFYLISKYTYSL